MGSFGSNIKGRLSSKDDYDYFKFTPSSEGSISLKFDAPTDTYTNYFSVSLWKLENGTYTNIKSKSSGRDIELVSDVLASTDYFIKISSYQSNLSSEDYSFKTDFYKKEDKPSTWGGAGASRNADAYFISKKYAKILYDEFNHNDFTTDTTIDWWMNDVIRKYNIPVYWAEPVLIETNKFESSF